MPETVRAYRTHTSTIAGPTGAPYENLVFKDTALSPAVGGSLWDSCPSLVDLCDPSLAFDLNTDWFGVTPATNNIGGWTTTTVTSGAVTMDATKGLKIDAGATTANQGVNLQGNRTFAQLAANKAVWMEGSFNFTGLTSLKIQFLFGLVAAQTACIASGAVGTDDKIAFDGVTATGVLQADCTASATTTNGTGVTLANSTSYRLGLYATPNNVDFWVNGAKVSSVTANIPTSALAPTVVVQSNGTVQPVVYCSWLRVFALR